VFFSGYLFCCQQAAIHVAATSQTKDRTQMNVTCLENTKTTNEQYFSRKIRDTKGVMVSAEKNSHHLLGVIDI
jgi:hypothetical protein